MRVDWHRLLAHLLLLPKRAKMQGQRINPHLRNLLQSGMLAVRVARADDLHASSLFGRPSM